jgi:hypothetical protein
MVTVRRVPSAVDSDFSAEFFFFNLAKSCIWCTNRKRQEIHRKLHLLGSQGSKLLSFKKDNPILKKTLFNNLFSLFCVRTLHDDVKPDSPLFKKLSSKVFSMFCVWTPYEYRIKYANISMLLNPNNLLIQMKSYVER